MEGGDLGFMTEEGATPEFAKVIRETPTGGVSRPFQTDMGWHVVKIDERRKERPPSIEELRGPILKHLTMMQIGDVLKELRQEAKIDKQTSPRNSTLDVDPFELPDEPKREATPTPPPALEAAVAPPPVSEVRDAAAEPIGAAKACCDDGACHDAAKAAGGRAEGRSHKYNARATTPAAFGAARREP